MTTTMEDRAEALFLELVELEAEARRRALESIEPLALRRRLEGLLATEGEVPAGFLEGEPATPDPYLGSGVCIGEFELIDKIGEGGMGAVYVARQSSPQREVAIKVIRSGRMTESAMRRFQVEIEALGALQHHGIARIYHAGTTEVTDVAGEPCSVPYFAMELVRGRPLLEYVRREGLRVRERLGLFLLVCDAVHHAHQRGVIHRDLKSENVLVSEEETTSSELSPDAAGLGQPKILDFGIARTLSPETESLLLETRAGDVLGSLSCMSPEQAGGDPARVDIRSDVFALGVLLYQLLAGRAPLLLAGLSLPEALRRIQEEEPPRLETFDPALRGDLSVIAAKALEKDPTRRYHSVRDLAQDVRRHLQGLPIEARADSALYVLRKELRRHRGIVLGVLLAFVFLGGFGLHATRQARNNRLLASRERAARIEAGAALGRANIDRGRLLGRAGNPLGEKILWNALFRDPDSTEALWALREYYLTQACLASRPPDHEAPAALDFLDGQTLVLTRTSGRLEILSAEDLRTLDAVELGATITCQAVLPREELLFLGTADGSILSFDLETRRIVASRAAHHDEVRAIVCGARALFSTSPDGTVREWELASGRLHPGHESRAGAFEALALGPGGELAAAGGGFVAVWEGALDEEPARLEVPRGVVASVAFSHEGGVLWAGLFDRYLMRWDLATGETQEHCLRAGSLGQLETDDVTGRGIVVGDWKFVSFELERWTEGRSFPVDDGRTRCAISLRANRVAAAEEDGAVRLWSLGDVTPCTVVTEASGPTSIAFSSDGQALFCGDQQGRVRLVDSSTLEERRLWQTHAGRVRVGAAPSGRWLGWTEKATRRLVVVDAATGEQVLVVEDVARNNPHAFGFHPLGPWVAVTMASGAVECREAGTGILVRSFETAGGAARALAFAPDGSELFVLDGRTALVHAFSVEDGRERRRFRGTGSALWTIDVDPAGKILAAGSSSGAVQLWEVDSGAPLPALVGSRGWVREVHFLRGEDGIVAAISGDDSLRLWDARQGRNLAEIDFTERTRPNSVSSFPGGRKIALGGSESESYVLDLELLDRRIARNLDYALARFGADAREDDVRRLKTWRAGILRSGL